MKLKFYGAAGFVTGSCYVLSFNGKKVMIDCGMYQGPKEVTKLNYEPFQFNPKEIDVLILTHAHIDHSGLIPKLCKEGFNGKIYCTSATKDLCRIMLSDSAHIQEMEAYHDNKRLSRDHKPLRTPLYLKKDVLKCMTQFRGFPYNELLRVFDGLEVVYRDAGHIIGSSMVEVFVKEKGVTKKIVFSGDLGQVDAVIIDDPTYIKSADYVLVESTYGGRIHEGRSQRQGMLKSLIQEVNKTGGKLIIPSFAIERTQEIIYELNELAESGQIPNVPIFVDSPLAIKATRVFRNHTENYDQEAVDLLAKGDDPFEFKMLKYTEKAEESKKLNLLKGAAVIISASGMCTGGRIKHHLKNHMSKPNSIIFFVGYQARGTLGRRIRQGAKQVKIYGESIKVKAKIVSCGGFSAHADQPQLLKWLNSFETKPKVFMVHGEPEEAKALKKAYGSGHIAKLYEEVEL